MSERSKFADRHIGPNEYQINTMLMELGYKDLDSFITAVVPKNIHIKGEIEKSLPVGISEVDAINEISKIARKIRYTNLLSAMVIMELLRLQLF